MSDTEATDTEASDSPLPEGVLATSETSRLCVQFSWVVVGPVVLHTPASDEIQFPDALTEDPGVYRLWFEPRPDRPEVYIGETSRLRRRGRQYRRGDGSQTTSKWVHDHLLASLQRGAKVTMWVVVDAQYSRDGENWIDTDLSHREHRLILENAALADAFADEVNDVDEGRMTARVLNKFAANRND